MKERWQNGFTRFSIDKADNKLSRYTTGRSDGDARSRLRGYAVVRRANDKSIQRENFRDRRSNAKAIRSICFQQIFACSMFSSFEFN